MATNKLVFRLCIDVGRHLSPRSCREDFTRLKKVVEKKKEAAEREKALMQQVEAVVQEVDDALLDDYDTQEQGDVYF